MNINIPNATSPIRKVDFSNLKKVDFSMIKKVDMSKICAIYPNPSVQKVNFLEAVETFIQNFKIKF